MHPFLYEIPASATEQEKETKGMVITEETLTLSSRADEGLHAELMGFER